MGLDERLAAGEEHETQTNNNNKAMPNFRRNGYTYELIIRPWRKGKARYEALRWKTGLKCTWERISFTEYETAKKL